MLFYNKYTVYTQSLCTEMPAERLIVILESAPCVNQSKVTVTWLISFTDEQKVVQMKLWTFCSTLSVFIRIYTVCMCCLSLWRLLPLSWWLLCLSCMRHLIHLSFLGCLCHDELFSSPGLVHKNILQLYIIICEVYLHLQTCTNRIHEAVMQAKARFSFCIYGNGKYEGYLNPPFTATLIILVTEIKAV